MLLSMNCGNVDITLLNNSIIATSNYFTIINRELPFHREMLVITVAQKAHENRMMPCKLLLRRCFLPIRISHNHRLDIWQQTRDRIVDRRLSIS